MIIDWNVLNAPAEASPFYGLGAIISWPVMGQGGGTVGPPAELLANQATIGDAGIRTGSEIAG